jgi:hypothetical protein
MLNIKPGGSIPDQDCVYIYRDREVGHARLYQDYFADSTDEYVFIRESTSESKKV